jgi:hypothetical protein
VLRHALGVTLLAPIVERLRAGFDRGFHSADPAEVPLCQVWKSFGGSNRRVTTKRAVVGKMTAKGRVDEGAAICARLVTRRG